MKHIIENFPFIKGASDCRIQCIRNLLYFYGIEDTDEMCFGLGEGLTFNYWLHKSGNIPLMVVLGRDLNTEKQLCGRFSIKMIKLQEDNDRVIKEIKNNNPILIDVDRFYLDYLPTRKAHFGLHGILAIGYDTKYEELYINDYLVDKTIAYSIDKINLARNSNCKMFNPNNNIYICDASQANSYLEKAVYIKAINNVCKKMLSDETSVGINAMERLKDHIRVYIDLSKKNDTAEIRALIKMQMDYFSILIYEMEETKSFYRGIYSKFLNQVFNKFNLKNLKDMSIELLDISKDWTNLAVNIRLNSKLEDKLIGFYEGLSKLIIREKRFFSDLGKLSERTNI